MRVADFVAQRLRDEGVSEIFMVPGGAAMHLNDAFGKCEGISCIANLHEQGSSIAAEAYSRVNSGLGVLLVTAGPGGTNAITGVAGAWLDSTPVICISGQVKSADLISKKLGVRQYGVQEIDIVSIVSPITKYAVTIQDPSLIKYELEKAIAIAKSGRKGPVWIDIPIDIQGADFIDTQINPYQVAEIEVSPDALEEKLDTLIHSLKGAERPLLLVGNGVRASGAVNQLHQLIERLKIPVMTTWLGMDLIDANDKYYFGRPGGIAPRYSNFIIQNCDLLIVIGARVDLGLVGYSYENLARAAKLVVVDIDGHEIEKFGKKLFLGINIDAGIFIKQFYSRLSQINFPHWHSWLSTCLGWKDRYKILNDVPKTSLLSMYKFSELLCDSADSNDIFAPGSSGFACEIFLLMYKCKLGQRIFHNRGTGSMGFGIPASIGACVASNNKRVICVDGDGGFQMNIQELETVSRLGLDIKFFVINNGGYASIRSSQKSYFDNLVCADSSSGLTLPSLEKLATAYNISYNRIESDIDAQYKIEDVLSSDGPVLCEVVVASDEPRQPRIASYRNDDGTMVSKPIEDLYPFLPRDEFSSNMIVDIL